MTSVSRNSIHLYEQPRVHDGKSRINKTETKQKKKETTAELIFPWPFPFGARCFDPFVCLCSKSFGLWKSCWKWRGFQLTEWLTSPFWLKWIDFGGRERVFLFNLHEIRRSNSSWVRQNEYILLMDLKIKRKKKKWHEKFFVIQHRSVLFSKCT